MEMHWSLDLQEEVLNLKMQLLVYDTLRREEESQQLDSSRAKPHEKTDNQDTGMKIKACAIILCIECPITGGYMGIYSRLLNYPPA